jgi:hypothetical protein
LVSIIRHPIIRLSDAAISCTESFNEIHTVWEKGPWKVLAIDKRISGIFVSEGKQNTQTLGGTRKHQKALGYTSYGKYVEFLDYPVDGSNQLLRNLDPYLPVYIVSHHRSWIQVQNTETEFRK